MAAGIETKKKQHNKKLIHNYATNMLKNVIQNMQRR